MLAGALANTVAAGRADLLREMAANWPFFATRLSMLEMVYAKADAELSAYYDELLVPAELQSIGAGLRQQLLADVATVLDIHGEEILLADQPWTAESIRLRNIYTDPLNFLQAELLKRNREREEPELEKAIMVTIAGIAAGMRKHGLGPVRRILLTGAWTAVDNSRTRTETTHLEVDKDMQRILKASLLVTFLSLLGQGAWAQDSYEATINSFRQAGQSAAFFDSAYGYAVFPTIGKGGIGVGGAHGKGRVFAAGRHVGGRHHDPADRRLPVGWPGLQPDYLLRG